MGKAKVRIIGEKIEVDHVDLSRLTTDCHGVEYTAETNIVFVDVVSAHCMADIFDLYHDDGKRVNKIWVLGGKLSPKLATPEIVFK